MTQLNRVRSRSASTAADDDSPLRPLLIFSAFAVVIGGAFTALSTAINPGGPFLLAGLLLGLVLPALILTARDHGAAGVKALLRDCIRLPRSRWWLPVAAFGLPLLAWTAAAAIGGARPLTWSLVTFYLLDVAVGAVVINIWEEMAWAGYLQRRAMMRWGTLKGALATTGFFTAIHVPLAFDGAASAGEAGWNVLLIAGVALGVRLIVARVDSWTGGSLLTLGILHSSFNATETVLEPGYDWVRIVVTIVVGVILVAFGRRRLQPSHRHAGHRSGGISSAAAG